MLGFFTASTLFLGLVQAGTVVWDGRFNDYSSATDLDKWSWANQVGSYQWYIHGTGPTTDYVNMSPNFKNPADDLSKQGVKLTISPTALWNSDMWRTELIPQTKANLGTGTLWYHFSVKKTGTNSPNPNYEHQVNFFESHFTELKYGWINGNPTTAPDNNLRWFVGGQSKWNVDWTPDVWHNFAYEINFSASTVGLWHSTGSADLARVGAQISASTSTNSADWHLGILRLPNRSGGTNDPAPEDWYFSGVYVESGSLNVKVGSGAGGQPTTPVPTPTTPVVTPTVVPTTTPTVVPTTTPVPSPTPTGPLAPKWSQCGGINWSGPTQCEAGSTCTLVNEHYSQCL